MRFSRAGLVKEILVLCIVLSFVNLVFTGCPSSAGGGDDSGSSSSSSSDDLASLDSVVKNKYKSTSNSAYWGVHDPKLFQDTDGTYYCYSTGWNTGVQIRSSSDAVTWKYVKSSAFSGTSSSLTSSVSDSSIPGISNGKSSSDVSSASGITFIIWF